jgi:hypothetical protein
VGDKEGYTEPVDDETVDEWCRLYRWVSPEHWKRHDEGPPTIRDGAFKNFPRKELKRVSIALEDTLLEADREPADLAPLGPRHGLAWIHAVVARKENQALERTPTADEPAHGDICGEKPTSLRRRLADQATWAIEPPA